MLAENLKLARKEAGLSIREVCDEIGIHKSVMSRWEGGSVVPTEERLEQLADIYGISVEELAYGVVR